MYDQRVVQRARQLRKQMTFAEVVLWQRIRKKQVLGVAFQRQRPIGHYIVDFFAPDLWLVVEVDGRTHDNPRQSVYDEQRERRLESLGLTVIRFTSEETVREPASVIDRLCATIEELLEISDQG